PGEPDRCVAFTLHALYVPEGERHEIVNACRGAQIGCVDCKKILARHLVATLAPFREKRQELTQRPGLVDEVLAAGNRRAATVAAATMEEVREAIHI
ncbi:MAG TPA: tryptophan--tRNA ligase, partial [Geobacterales bacterium]|nr:tryptophan--tRNA ligase [Geobacterales bacterium]